MANPPTSLSVEKLLADFDGAWRSGAPPHLDYYLPLLPHGGGAEQLRREALEELIRIDLEYRWRPGTVLPAEPADVRPVLGRRPLLDRYAARFPEVKRWGPLSPDLIAWEYRLRHCWGDRPGHAEYLTRFAAQWASLQEALREMDADLAREFGRDRPAAGGDMPRELARRIDRAASESFQAGPPPPAPVSMTPAELLGLLRQQDLIGGAQLDELTQKTKGRAIDSRTLAKILLERNWLTPYQANQLLQGRGGELRLGAYVLLERLGEGGAGQVFKARQLRMDRIVALKVIHKELVGDEEVIARFYREMQIVGGLSHPNIVHAFDAGPVAGTHVLVMEYIEGIDLGRLVKRSGPLPVEQACDCIRQAATGLQYAHERGLVHRDVKPSNLLLIQGGARPQRLVKVLDLGLARLCRNVKGDQTAQLAEGKSANTLTPVGAVMMMGTPDYLAPEQALDFHAADIRADIYGLGCTLFYLLTGQPPFPGGTVAEKLMRHMQAPPPDVRTLRPEVPPALARMLTRMMAKRPDDRLQTPAEVVAALAGATRGALTARLVGLLMPRGATTGLRRRFLIGVVGLLLLGTILLTLFRPLTPDAKRASELQALRARADRRPAGFSRQLWQDILDFRMRHVGTPEAQEAGALLMQVPSALDQLQGKPQATIAVLSKENRLRKLAVSPDCRVVAGLEEVEPASFRLHLWDPITQKERPALEGVPAWPTAVAFSPDGRTLAIGSGKDAIVKLWSLEAGKWLGPLKNADNVSCLAFAPDGQSIAVGGYGHTVHLWEPSAARPRLTLLDLKDQVGHVSFSPDGRLVAATSLGGESRIWNTATGKVLATSSALPGAVLAFTPDSRGVLLSPRDSPGQEWELASDLNSLRHKRDLPALPLNWPFRGFAFAPNGKTAVVISGRSVLEFQAGSLTPTGVTWQLPGGEWLPGAFLTSDGRHIAMFDGTGAIIVRLIALPGN